jgi:hypothetical protein
MRLEIYVASHCVGCQEALRIADLARGIAGLDVAVINLDHATSTRPVPANVVAVPTYLLDGRVVSLGNPYREEFLAQMRQHTSQEDQVIRLGPAEGAGARGTREGKEPAP